MFGAAPTFQAFENIRVHGDSTLVKKISKRTDVISGQPPVVWLSRVIAHPAYTGLYDETGALIPDSSIFVMPPNAPQFVRDKFQVNPKGYEPRNIDVSDLVESDTDVVFGGAAHAHYGHQLLDGLNRLWFHCDLPTLYLDAHLQIHGNKPHVQELLTLGRPRTIYQLSRPTLFKRVLMPHSAIQSAFTIYSNADCEHLHIANSALEQAKRPVARKIYLSRRGVANRTCHGEEELEQRLSDCGFDIIRPETLPVIEQIALFNRAKWIVGPGGSAFHNILFKKRGRRVRTVQLTWLPPNLRYPLIDRIKGHRSFYAQTMVVEAHDEGPRFNETRLDIDRTMAVLRSIGALRPRLFSL